MMWPFKKRYPIAAKYQRDDFVNFNRRGEMRFGWIYDASVDKGGHVTYTMQIGGQCPSLLYEIPEEDILGIRED